MPQQKSYAIRCTTEEQARECRDKGFMIHFFNKYGMGLHADKNKYKIISYDEAISLGLLGDKNKGYRDKLSRTEEPQKVEPINLTYENGYERGLQVGKKLGRRESPSEDIVEKIMEEIDKYGGVEVYTREGFENLLKKHLTSK